MRLGHILASLGALLVLVGGTALTWQHFELADVTARGYEASFAGQLLLALASLVLLTSLLGIALPRRRYSLAGATLVAALFSFGGLAYAHVGKLDLFATMPFEAITMGAGYELAVWGALLMFVGPLVVFSSEPAWTRDAQLLRVALLWKDTVVQEKVLQTPQTFTIGDDLRNDLVLPQQALRERFPLFRVRRGGHYALGLHPDFGGQLTLNERVVSLPTLLAEQAPDADGATYLPIALGDWGVLERGDLRIFFQFVTPEHRRRRAGLVVFEETVWSSLAVSFFAQATFVILGVLLWQESFSRGVLVEQKREPDIEAAVTTLTEPDLPEILDDGDAAEVAKRAGGDEGRFGDRDEDPAKRSEVPRVDAPLTDRVDPKKIGLTKLLATDTFGGSGAISEILTSSSDGLTNRIAVAMAGDGSDFVVGYGTGGMGFQGDGHGGGDDGVGRIMGPGTFDVGGDPGIRAGLGPHTRRRVGVVDVGSGQAKGFCSQSHIASVVKRRAGAIRACYEQRLQVAKDLRGKLTVRWTIQLDGQVDGVNALADTLGDAATTNCILRHLRRLRFQKPDGGVCVVQWPFVFSPG